MSKNTKFCKCSLHLGKRYSRKHNLREHSDDWNKDGHIDNERTSLNKVLHDQSLIDFFNQTFGESLEQFNQKNVGKHSDRLIGFKSKADYDDCPPEERRSRAVKGYYQQQQKRVQEAIIQLGDHDTYWKMVEQHGQKKADEIYTAYLTAAFEKWQKDNPSLKVWSAVIHMDEVKDGSPHLHLDFLPIAESSRGLSVKISTDGALKELGYKHEKTKDGKKDKYHETPYKKWLKDTRKSYEDFAQQFANDNDLNLVILPSEKSTVPHEQPQAFKERQERVKAINWLTQQPLDQQAVEQLLSNANAIRQAAQEKADKITKDSKKAAKEYAKISLEVYKCRKANEELAADRANFDSIIEERVAAELARAEKYTPFLKMSEKWKQRVESLFHRPITEREDNNYESESITTKQKRDLRAKPKAKSGKKQEDRTL